MHTEVQAMYRRRELLQPLDIGLRRPDVRRISLLNNSPQIRTSEALILGIGSALTGFIDRNSLHYLD
jgi:hypothetical protein